MKKVKKVNEKKLYNWNSWEEKRALAAAQADEDEVSRIMESKSPLRTRTDRERSVFRISVDRIQGL